MRKQIIRRAWEEDGEEEDFKSVSDNIAALTIFGNAEQFKERLEIYHSTGVNFPIIFPYYVTLDQKSSLISAFDSIF